MDNIVNKLSELLSETRNPVLNSERIGAKKPAISTDIPALLLTLSIDSNKGIGIGRSMRSGEAIVQNRTIVDVVSASDVFSNDLKKLRLLPLPLKRNPASSGKDFNEKDIQVHNVTDPSAIIQYKFMLNPFSKQEYRIDVSNAEIVFGSPQSIGEKLEVTHWTVTWRDRIQCERYNGLLHIEIFAATSDEVQQAAQRLHEKMNSDPISMREKGFYKILPCRLDPLENTLIQPPTGSPFAVWRQRREYRFVFEQEEGGQLTSGGPIKRISVDLDEHLAESFSIPR